MSKMRRIGLGAVLGVVLLCGCGGGDDDSSGGGSGGGGGQGTASGSGGMGVSSGSGGMTVMTGSGGMTGASGSGGMTGASGSGGSTVMTMKDAGGGSMKDAGGSGGSSGALDGGSGDAGGGSGTFKIESKAFADGSTIDMKYRCTGPSPDLKWSGAPAKTMSYAIVFHDITPAGTNGIDTAGTIHWVIYDIGKGETMLPEGVMVGYMPSMPSGAKQAPNYNSANGFQGPCYPLSPSTATYELTLYAIDVAMLPGLSMSSTAADVQTAIMAHTLGSAKLTIMSTT